MSEIITVKFYSYKGKFLDGWQIPFQTLFEVWGHKLDDATEEEIAILAAYYIERTKAHNLILNPGDYSRTCPASPRTYRHVY